jgi:hypothetical protein
MHPAIFNSRGNLVCYPIKWFTIEDVAAAIYEYDMPIHPIYNMMPIGVMPIRLGYATSLDLMNRGTIQFLRANYPILYRRLIESYPDARLCT